MYEKENFKKLLVFEYKCKKLIIGKKKILRYKILYWYDGDNNFLWSFFFGFLFL